MRPSGGRLACDTEREGVVGACTFGMVSEEV